MLTYIWLIIFALCLVLPTALVLLWNWLIVPLRIRKKHRHVLHRTLTPTQVDQLTPEMQQFLGSVVRQFKAQGFEVAANVHSGEVVLKTQSVQVLFVQRRSGNVAVANIAWNARMRSFVYGVTSKFADQT